MAKKENQPKADTKKVIVKKITGVVDGISGKNTIKVRVQNTASHPIYERIYKFHRSFLADADLEKNDIKVGDLVMIEACRPISKRKSWKLVKKLS